MKGEETTNVERWFTMDDSLTLHPSAEAEFNARADALAAKLGPLAPSPSAPPFASERFVSHHIRQADIGTLAITGAVDASGRMVSRSFLHQRQIIGLSDDDYVAFGRLIESMHRVPSLRQAVARESLEVAVFQWLENRFKGVSTAPMTTYVLTDVSSKLEEREIWTPVAHLHVQSPFALGHVTFKTISRELVDHWEEEARRKYPDYPSPVAEYYARLRKRLQGLAAGVVKVHAEERRAYELGLEGTEEAVALLRVLGPWNLDPTWVSYCTVLGKEPAQSTFQFTLHERSLAHVDERTGLDRRDLLLDDEAISMMRPYLEVLDRMLKAPVLTDFQRKLLDALTLYSRSSIARDPADKLVYILVPVEALLLRNQSEPIVDRVGRRMAFFLGKTATERAAIVSCVAKVYGTRSAFLHHGETVDDMETLRAFMWHAWLCFAQMLENAERFERTEQLLDRIDHMSLGGQ